MNLATENSESLREKLKSLCALCGKASQLHPKEQFLLDLHKNSSYPR